VKTYVYDQAWELEHDRLRALEERFDGWSRRQLADVGVNRGWRCLEVGAGAGGIARWLVDQAGPTGRVVATDLDPRFLLADRRDNLDIRQHDVLTDPIEDATFDLVHARAVVEHLTEPDRARTLTRLVSALRPGGWLVVEDLDYGGAMIPALARYSWPTEHSALSERMTRALEALATARGASVSYGSQLPMALTGAGLSDVNAEVYGSYVWGSTEPGFVALSMRQLRPHLTNVGLLTEDEIDEMAALLASPGCGFLPFLLVTARGRRPAG
jgi:SAM-dependent methyltransferase